jgi:hypothetical protein
MRHWIAVLATLLTVGASHAAEKSVAEEILDTLWGNGQITDEQYGVLLEKARSEKELTPSIGASDNGSWTDRVTLFGDFRGRNEQFWYRHDSTGSSAEDRNRWRYRLRLGLKAKVNDQIDLKVRLATGDESTSRNQTLGRSATTNTTFDPGPPATLSSATEDWTPDGIYIDQAYISWHPFAKEAIPLGGKKLDFMIGKMSNILRSKVGKDLLHWDSDLTPEGLGFTYAIDPSESLGLTLNSGH